MKSWSLFLLRLSIGLLVFWWGLDKLTNLDHAMGVANAFYGGITANATLLPALGVAQMAFAVAYIVGFKRGLVDWVVTLINAGSMAAVWKSVVDPFGHFMEGTNSLFFPALTVFAGCLVLIALRDQESMVLDARRAGAA